MTFLENFKIDTWWKIILYLGVGAIVASFYFKITFIEGKHLFGFGLGMFLIGISFGIAEQNCSVIKPPNAYTGPAALISWKEFKYNPITAILLLAGLIMVGLFGFLIIRNLI